MSIEKIDGALYNAYSSINLGLPISFEGEDFEPPTDRSDWVEISQIPAETGAASNFERGRDAHTGIYQLDFYTKPGTGRSALVGYIQAVRDEFIAGKNLELDGQYVRIVSVDRSQIVEYKGWMRVAVSINWSAQTIRPAI